MLGAIKHNFAHLLDFRGRDARQTFWFYVLFVFVVNMAVGFVIVIPFMGMLMSTVVMAAQTGDPAAIEGAMAARMGEMLESMVWIGLGTGLLNVVLLAAALTRRLHDSNLAGRWGLLPLGLQAFTSIYAITRIDELKALMTTVMSQVTDPQAAMAAQGQYMGQSLLGWVAIVAFVVLGVRDSTKGPNRYAEEPVCF